VFFTMSVMDFTTKAVSKILSSLDLKKSTKIKAHKTTISITYPFSTIDFDVVCGALTKSGYHVDYRKSNLSILVICKSKQHLSKAPIIATDQRRGTIELDITDKDVLNALEYYAGLKTASDREKINQVIDHIKISRQK
jgi:hypothetical protein